MLNGDDKTAYAIYLNARRYAKAAYILNQCFQAGDYSLTPTDSVNAALALELYFKAIFYIEEGKHFKINGRHSHDITKIYDSLRPNLKLEMESHFNELLKHRSMFDVELLEKATNNKIPRRFRDNLVSWSKVFVEMRYIYDRSSVGLSMMFFTELRQTVLFVLQKLRPDWSF